MKNILNLKKIALVAFVSILGVSCSKSDDAPLPTPAPKSITTIASGNPELTTLVKALVKAELSATLDATGTYTVFAPTNAAFSTYFGEGESVETTTKEKLKSILLNHVLKVTKKSGDLTTGYVSTMSPVFTSTLTMYVDLVKTPGKVLLNGFSTVTSADILASNGVIHIVDKVIPLPTILRHAEINPTFSKLYTAVKGSASMFDKLNNSTTEAPLTLLAPNDAAFTNATFITTTTTPTQLATILLYHAVAGNKQSNALTDTQALTAANSQKLIVIKKTDVKFEDVSGNRRTVIIAVSTVLFMQLMEFYNQT
jgi:uncharacterized surface protein with fasciclin (FAS1) repeats